MCTSELMMSHHNPACGRGVYEIPRYTYCKYAVRDPVTNEPLHHCGRLVEVGAGAERWVVDGNCEAGQCRLENLGYCWRCCQCGFGGNREALCKRPLADTFCYHKVCVYCTADTQPQPQQQQQPRQQHRRRR